MHRVLVTMTGLVTEYAFGPCGVCLLEIATVAVVLYNALVQSCQSSDVQYLGNGHVPIGA
jgi:hypothetical protein